MCSHVASQYTVVVDVVCIVARATDVVRRRQQLVKVLRDSDHRRQVGKVFELCKGNRQACQCQNMKQRKRTQQSAKLDRAGLGVIRLWRTHRCTVIRRIVVLKVLRNPTSHNTGAIENAHQE